MVNDEVTGIPTLNLRADAGHDYLVQTSTNLMHWSALAILANTNGTVRCNDLENTNRSHLFYRVLSP